MVQTKLIEFKSTGKQDNYEIREMRGPYPLPKGWKWVRLGDVAYTTSGGTPSRSNKKYWQNGNIPWVKSGELEDNIIYDTEEKITEIGLKNSNCKIFPKGTLLVAMYGATVGKTAILGIDAATNQAVCAIFPNNIINRDYIRYYLVFIRPKLIERSKNLGGAQPNISQEFIKSLKIPIPFHNGKPDLQEQKRIVAKIEALFQKLDRVKELRRQAKKEAEELLQAALHKVFSRADEKGWKWVRLGDVAEIIMGQSPPSETYNDNGEGLPFYQGKVDFGDLYPSPRIYCTSPSRVAEPHDILISVRAPVGPVNIANQQCGIGRGLAAIRPKNLKSFYVFYWFKYLEDKWNVGGTTFGAIKKPDLINHKLPIPFRNGKPDLEEQKRIVAYLDEIAEKQRKLLKLYEDTEREIEEMRQAILNKAFRGEL